MPSERISTSSAGESSPRVATEQAEPRNRRVEVRFEPELRVHLVAPLTLPSLTPAPPEGVPPPLLPTLPPIWQPETPEETARRIFAPIPARPAPSASVSDLVYQRLDDSLNATMERLGVPAWARGPIRDGAHAALSKGAESLLDAALDQTSLGSEERDAIRTTFRAVVQIPIQ